jgi:DNA-binding CsgD family transcriptional regulator
MRCEKNEKNKKGEYAKRLLTEREIEVITLICKEYSNKQIAAELGISPYTVEDHKKSLRMKTKSFTVVGLVLYATRNQIFMQLIWLMLYPVGEGNFCEQLLPDGSF